MKIVFDGEALADLRNIHNWIAKDSPRAADRVVSRIFDKVEVLALPGLAHIGRPGRDHGTRELIEAPYIVVYEVHEDRDLIVILAVVHGAQDRERDK
jgi:addiction module RelE/StbE family toxin